MQSESTKKIVYLNTFATLMSQFVQMLLGFAIRKIFIDSLGVAYLGYNSVFSNILQMLNLADLGIGVAITSFLYKPLVEKEEKRINALMYIYSRIYHAMGFLVTIVGIIVLAFVPVIIPDAQCSNSFLRILFAINLAGTVSTYFLAYKRTFLIAEQRSYLVTAVDSAFYLICSIAQIVLLLLWPNYIAYLVINVLKNVLSNAVLVVICNHKNKFLNVRNVDSVVVNEYKQPIFKYVKDLFVSRIGAYVYYGTDNIIISVFKGSLLAGYLSNYTMITNLVNNVIVQILSSLQATYGQYISSEKESDKQKQMTSNYAFTNYLTGNFCMVCILFMIQPFVSLYFGDKYILGNDVVTFLSINLLLTIMIQIPSQVFVVYKLYHYDYPIVITSTILNIVISAILVQKMGISGVLIGTFVTSLLYLFSRYYIIAHFVFHTSYTHYLIRIGKYFLYAIISVALASLVSSGFEANTWILFVIKGILVGTIAVIIPLILSIRSSEYKFLIGKFVPAKYQNKKIIALTFSLTIILMFGCAFIGNKLYKLGYVAEKGSKSLQREDSYIDESYKLSHDKYIHISVDDTIELFEDISAKDYLSIFDNSTLKWMKSLHESYGAVFSCYVYYSDDDFDLVQCTSKYLSEFEENADWLRFGFHTVNESTDYENSSSEQILHDYQMTITELERIVGQDAIDNVVRLQGFSGNEDNIKALAQVDNQPIIGLLTADDTRVSYGLDENSNAYIYSHDEMYSPEYGVSFISTDLRIEFVDSITRKIKEFDTDSWNNQLMDLIFFTHEWELNEPNKKKIETLVKWGEENAYCFNFPEDVMK